MYPKTHGRSEANDRSERAARARKFTHMTIEWRYTAEQNLPT
jgi:hypothetical protein